MRRLKQEVRDLRQEIVTNKGYVVSDLNTLEYRVRQTEQYVAKGQSLFELFGSSIQTKYKSDMAYQSNQLISFVTDQRHVRVRIEPVGDSHTTR